MYNKVILIGNVGREPEVRVLESGAKMARFTLATNEVYHTSQGERNVHTEWHNIVAWRSEASYVEDNVHVGSEIYVEGRIRSREAVDVRTKTTSRVYEIVASSLRLNIKQNKVIGDSVEVSEKPFCDLLDDLDGIPF